MAAQHIDRDPPKQKHPPLIVVLAFDRDDEGELRPVVGPLEPRSEASAKTIAAALSGKHAGAIARKHTAELDQGEFGPPEILFQRGQVADSPLLDAWPASSRT